MFYFFLRISGLFKSPARLLGAPPSRRLVRGLSNREVMDPEGPPILLAVRFDLDCPFSQKDDAKALGARWDPTNKTWYVPADKDLRPFRRWVPGAHLRVVRRRLPDTARRVLHWTYRDTLASEITEAMAMGDDYSLDDVLFDRCWICDGIVRQSVTGEEWEGWMKCECTPCKKCGTFFDGEGLSNAIAVPDPYEMLCLECSAREQRPKTHTGGLSQEFLAGMFKYGSPSYESARRSLVDRCTHCDGIVRHFPSGQPYRGEEQCKCRPCEICRRWWNPSTSQRCDKCTESDLESKSESEAGDDHSDGIVAGTKRPRVHENARVEEKKSSPAEG